MYCLTTLHRSWTPPECESMDREDQPRFRYRPATGQELEDFRARVDAEGNLAAGTHLAAECLLGVDRLSADEDGLPYALPRGVDERVGWLLSGIPGRWLYGLIPAVVAEASVTQEDESDT